MRGPGLRTVRAGFGALLLLLAGAASAIDHGDARRSETDMAAGSTARGIDAQNEALRAGSFDDDAIDQALEPWRALARSARESVARAEAAERIDARYAAWRATLGGTPELDSLWSESNRIQDAIAAAAGAGEPSLPALPGELAFLTLGDSADATSPRTGQSRRDLLLEEYSGLLRQALGARVQRLEAERRVRSADRTLAERQLAFLEAEIGQRMREHLAAARALSWTAIGDRDATDSRARRAQAVLALADEAEALAPRVLTLMRERAEQARKLADAQQQLAEARTWIANRNGASALGLPLARSLVKLAPEGALEADLGRVHQALAELRLARLSGWHAEDSERGPGRLVHPAATDPDARLEATAEHMRGALDAVRIELEDRLAKAEAMLAERVATENTLRALVRTHLLWVPSHEPIGAEWINTVLARWRADAPGAHRPGAAAQGETAWLARWPAFAALLGLLAGIYALRSRLRRLSIDGAASTANALVALGRALVALAATVVLALPGVLVLLIVVQWIAPVGGGSDVYRALVGQAMPSPWPLLALLALVEVAAEGGAGERRFGWSDDERRRVRIAAQLGALLLLVGQLAPAWAWYLGELNAVGAECRVLLMAGWGGLAVLGFLVLAPGAPSLGPREARSWPWGRACVRGGWVLGASAIVTLAALGYALSASALGRVLASAAAGLVLARFVHGHAQSALVGEPAPAGASASGLEPSTPDPDAAQDRDHTRAGDVLALAHAATVLAVLAIAFRPLAPAVLRLGEITLWTVQAAPGGAAGAVSLLDAGFALAAVVVAGLSLRALPGLAALVGNRNDGASAAGTRFALTALARYAIVLAGLVMACSALGLRWSDLQWMAAALTVGLGFGLQEVLSNFVSGLIVLFERRVRVGDLITVGGVTGTVSEITIRCTTVVDTERREVLVPNKHLITQQLVNWTMSDSIHVAVARVGVALDSDPERVQALLLQAAPDADDILLTPPPRALLVGFGVNVMEFELRVSLARADRRTQALSALYRRIIKVLRQGRIEIVCQAFELPSAGAIGPARERTQGMIVDKPGGAAAAAAG